MRLSYQLENTKWNQLVFYGMKQGRFADYVANTSLSSFAIMKIVKNLFLGRIIVLARTRISFFILFLSTKLIVSIVQWMRLSLNILSLVILLGLIDCFHHKVQQVMKKNNASWRFSRLCRSSQCMGKVFCYELQKFLACPFRCLQG